ncbi:MAG: xanthine dehydrogenase family protein molybdopterin-binding subunit [Acidobacteriota bacterium]|nr:xanthine dehydrogenase family protein molybdopterin-binding subunit [Acidobacteriota bacterium]
MQKPNVGQSVFRKEAADKVTGRAQYVDDLTFPDMLHGVTVRSPIARGRLRGVQFGDGIPWHEFTIVTAQDIKDIPGTNCVALILEDQPYLASDTINHPEEPILLLAHRDKYLLEEARRAIAFDIEPLPAIFTIEDSLNQTETIWGKDNSFKTFLIEKGDVDAAWAHADFIVEGEYETGAQEQLYIEPNGMIAIANREEGVTVWGSMQCPYYVHKALIKLFGLPPEKIRVVQAVTGGGFGGKEEYPSVIAGHAALLAWKAGKPVKLIYDRAEDMAATTKRHPSKTRIRTAVGKDGKLLATEIDFTIDGGAYATLSSVVLSRGTIHAAGPYNWPNVRVRSRAVATNHPPHGAFRGFGAPQSIFAMERHLNQVAQTVGLSPEELRRRNFLKPGETTSTGQVIHEKIDLSSLLDRALKLSDYHTKKTRFAELNAISSTEKKGIGFATFMHGAGFTGSGEVYLSSVVGVEATETGKVRVLTSNTEIGQGSFTIFSQIAADALGIDFSQVEIAQPDTANVPNSGPTVASRTTMIVGKLVESAALGLRQTLVNSGLLGERYSAAEFAEACRQHIAKHGELKSFSKYEPPPGVHWDDEKYQGEAYGTYAWAVYVAEVTVDLTTYETRVDDFIALQEVGKVINPVLAAGQIEGGVAQAIGYALYENVVWREGRMINNQMTNYIMPTSADVPPIRVYFEELPYAYGPSGAKGIGELPMDGPAPAILNAIEDAIGQPVNEIPLIPETLMQMMTTGGGND